MKKKQEYNFKMYFILFTSCSPLMRCVWYPIPDTEAVYQYNSKKKKKIPNSEGNIFKKLFKIGKCAISNKLIWTSPEIMICLLIEWTKPMLQKEYWHKNHAGQKRAGVILKYEGAIPIYNLDGKKEILSGKSRRRTQISQMPEKNSHFPVTINLCCVFTLLEVLLKIQLTETVIPFLLTVSLHLSLH